MAALAIEQARFGEPQHADLSDPATRERLSQAAAKAIVRLAARWRLSTSEASVLVGISPRTWARVKRGEASPFSQDELTRISLLTGIFKALHIVFSEPLADDWVGLANAGPLYSGRRPIDAMARGGIPVMVEVRRHLDSLRGGL